MTDLVERVRALLGDTDEEQNTILEAADEIERLRGAIADAMDALAQGGGGVRAFDILTRAMQDKLEDKHG